MIARPMEQSAQQSGRSGEGDFSPAGSNEHAREIPSCVYSMCSAGTAA